MFDPVFREQFEISRPSQGYQTLLAAVPVAFVGSEERLTATVRLLCKELQTEFAEKGVTLPPWRDVQAMLTKWRPSARPTARASMGSAPVPRPAVHQAAAAQLLQPPAAVKHDFFLGAPSLSKLTSVLDSTACTATLVNTCRPASCCIHLRRLLVPLWSCAMHVATLPTDSCSAWPLQTNTGTQVAQSHLEAAATEQAAFRLTWRRSRLHCHAVPHSKGQGRQAARRPRRGAHPVPAHGAAHVRGLPACEPELRVHPAQQRLVTLSGPTL